MGKLSTTLIPTSNNLWETITYKFGRVTTMLNDDLLWQIRLCSEPGKVKVIAAFEDKNDAITFMTLISKHKGHGEKISLEEKITGCSVSKEDGNGSHTYSIEHNTNEFDEVL